VNSCLSHSRVPRMMADSRSARLWSPRRATAGDTGPSPERVQLGALHVSESPVRVVQSPTLRDSSPMVDVAVVQREVNLAASSAPIHPLGTPASANGVLWVHAALR